MQRLPSRPILCIEFSVLHEHKYGWQDDFIGDVPLAGAMRFLWECGKYFDVYICSPKSHRAASRASIQGWVETHFEDYMEKIGEGALAPSYLGMLKYPVQEPPCFLRIDDRAITFQGEFPTPEDLKRFQPWWRR